MMLKSMRQGGRVRTTVNLDDALLARAAELTGTSERATLIRRALEALIQQESARRLATLGGSDGGATAAPRHRETAP